MGFYLLKGQNQTGQTDFFGRLLLDALRPCDSHECMGKSKGSEYIPDDIELLNVHRYPESYPGSIVAHIRNSKSCQKRLEDLLKGIPTRRGVRSQPVEPVYVQTEGEEKKTGPANRAGVFERVVRWLGVSEDSR